MTRIFLDANILFSAAHNPKGLATLIISYHEKLTLVSCPFAVAEAQRNIIHKYPSLLLRLEELIANLELVPNVSGETNLNLTPQDTVVILSAMSGKADIFLSGDKRFIEAVQTSRLAQVARLRAYTLSEFFDALARGEEPKP